jgi:hypothetical protein
VLGRGIVADDGIIIKGSIRQSVRVAIRAFVLCFMIFSPFGF